MLCPYCKNEIKDGFLMCSNCGREISYVPTFDAEVEGEMDKALSRINDAMADTVDLSGYSELSLTKDLTKTASLSELKEKLGKNKEENAKALKKKIGLVAIAFLILLVIAIFAVNFYISYNSYDSYIMRADECIENGDYEGAIPLYKAAMSKDDTSLYARYGLGNSLYLIGNIDEAKEILLDTIKTDDSYKDAYALLITIYEQDGEYMKINDLISSCNNSSIYEQFKKYLALPPGFSDDEGSYDSSFTLNLLVDTAGSIYYTLDGSEPNEDSILYTDPIKLDPGKNVVRAIFINEYGIKSESVSKIYEIEEVKPIAPVIKPEEGHITTPGYISAKVPHSMAVYYTTDGSMPDEKSKEYIEPIPMRPGETVYKFISIDDNGVRSDITTVTYSLDVSTSFSESEAVNYLVNSFTASGRLADVSGVASALDGMYQFKSIGIIESNGKTAFLIEEYYKSNESNQDYLPTGNYYGVDINDANIYSVTKNENGKYALN